MADPPGADASGVQPTRDPGQSPPNLRFLGVALGTFHTALSSLVVLQFAFRSGGLGGNLADLNTIVGLGLFVALWAIVTAASTCALRGLDVTTLDVGSAIASGAKWGGIFGSGFVVVPFLVGGPVALVLAVARGEFQLLAVLIATVFGAFAAMAAFFVGAAFGLAFAVLDGALLRLSWLLMPRAQRTKDATGGVAEGDSR